ncbi:GNAT family N-acetyltransferase [Rhodobacteraceae bacterium RKSG542]|uniref:GNAT family N-acetyltransferase n=1 Tax=Pseudovibrio flavus TaxID=2529854 RepID=UPI0012BBC44F|nr:GNAT family N-acetyltransferase [Pseudovibrio flavus]MTI18330.1 GNAT family N-acetyltransferase [Pseudovibrio flavus]
MKQNAFEAHVISPLKDGAIKEKWRTLAANALEPNPFYSPEFVEPYAKHLLSDETCVVVVTSTDRQKALAALPLRKMRSTLLFQTTQALAGQYGPLGTILLSKDGVSSEALQKLIETACDLSPSNTLVIPFHPTHTKSLQLLEKALEDSPFTLNYQAEEERGYQDTTQSGHTTFHAGKNLKARRKKLERLGELHMQTYRQSDAILAHLPDFLDLEERSWKGLEGTALASQSHSRKFVEEFVEALTEANQIRIHTLVLDEMPIASMILLGAESHQFAWKTAFDESYARYSPGRILLWLIAEQNESNPQFRKMDSLASPENQMVNATLPDRMPYVQIAISKGPISTVATSALQQTDALKEHAKQTVKRLLGRKIS